MADAQEIMEGLFGQNAPYPGMPVEWEVFAGDGAVENGPRKGRIVSISWCEHCGQPTFKAEDEFGENFSIRFSETLGRWVCGSDAPK